MDRYFNVMEKAGNSGSGEPVMLYELYRSKGLKERATAFRKEAEKEFANYNLPQFFDQADARLTNSPVQ